MSVYLALIEGDISFIKDIIDKNITKGTSPVEIIETILLPALSEVGDAYNSGEIYLPDVLKCTTNFSNVFDYLNQFCDEANFLLKSKKILLATVRGDVHDIGKNIVSAVLKTNGYEIIDLGVKVDNQIILQKAIENSVDYIAVSGIISPSLHEMEKLAELLFSKNIKIPLIVGGAATSKLHTALKLELLFPEKVLYASNPVNMINSLNSIESNPNYLKDISTEYKSIREEYSKKLCNANDTLWHRPKKVVESFNRPNEIGIWELVDYDLQKILDKLNWKQFYSKWQIKSNSEFAKIAKENLKHDALNLINKVRESKLLEANAIYGIFEAESGESYFDIISQSNVRYRFDIEQIDCTKQNKSVCDYIAKKDYLGLFIATIDINLKNDSLFLELEKKDAYKSLLIKILADSMVEAFAEILHNQIIKNKWVGEDNQREYYSIRPAFGFKMLPNHSQKEIVFQILNAHNIGVSLTETYAMEPASTVCALVINNSKAEYTE
jgi:5-methyltetrahydrofolate--homocysteine methyltransferase